LPCVSVSIVGESSIQSDSTKQSFLLGAFFITHRGGVVYPLYSTPITLSCRCALCNYSTSLHSQLHSLGSYTSLYSQLNSLGSYTHSCCPRQHRICCRRLGSSHPLILFSLLTFSSFCCYISCAAVLPLFIGCNGYNGRPFQLTRLGFTCFYFRLMLLPIFLSLSAAPIMPTHSYFFLLFITLHTLHMSQLANVTPNTVKCRVPRLILFHFLVLMGLG
jgi:hypothetical protein